MCLYPFVGGYSTVMNLTISSGYTADTKTRQDGMDIVKLMLNATKNSGNRAKLARLLEIVTLTFASRCEGNVELSDGNLSLKRNPGGFAKLKACSSCTDPFNSRWQIWFFVMHSLRHTNCCYRRQYHLTKGVFIISPITKSNSKPSQCVKRSSRSI